MEHDRVLSQMSVKKTRGLCWRVASHGVDAIVQLATLKAKAREHERGRLYGCAKHLQANRKCCHSQVCGLGFLE